MDWTTKSIFETGHSRFWFQQDLNLLRSNRLEWERNEKANDPNFISLESLFSHDDVDGETTLQLVHLIGLFLLFVCGNSVAAISFFIEMVRLNVSKIKQMIQQCLVTKMESVSKL